MSRLDGRVALVTGGGSGIGRAVCDAFAAEGATVVVADRDLDAARQPAGGLAHAEAVLLDVTDRAQVDTVIDAAVDHLGRLDILASIAGVDAAESWKQRVGAAWQAADPSLLSTDLPDEEWLRLIDVNLNGTFWCCRAALRHMERQRSGVIANISSGGAHTGAAGLPHYTAAKGAVLALTRSLAREAIRVGVRVNAVAPGSTDTPMLHRGNLGTIALPPIGRVARPDEVAAAFVFLCSDDASYFVGETLNVNGGYHMA